MTNPMAYDGESRAVILGEWMKRAENAEAENAILKRRLEAAKLIIQYPKRTLAYPRGCAECGFEATDFICNLLGEESMNEKRRDDCPFTIFEGSDEVLTRPTQVEE
jgi:hypothetical protein